MLEHIDLQLGWPSPSLFPSSQILEGTSNIINSEGKSTEALIYGPDAGCEPLRRGIAEWLSSIYISGGPIAYERICVHNGASANLGNILARFTEPGYTRNIWMIEPSYFLACPIFTDAGFQGLLRGVPEEEEGLDIKFLEHSIERNTGTRYTKLYKHVIYGVPTFSNPSGKTMSLRRREQLVRLARKFDALVITDDVYDALCWSIHEHDDISQLGNPPPRLVDIDKVLDHGPKDEWGNTISNGSFSKITAPGIRVGWAEGTSSLSLALSQLGSTRPGGCPAQLTASIVHELLSSGTLQRHLSFTVIPTFQSRYYALIRAVQEHLIPLGFQISTGQPYNASLGTTTKAISSLHHRCVPDAGGYFTYLLLSWAWHTTKEILEGIRRIACLAEEVRKQDA
ncbi:PLP-dependent transferase [Corynespora cassiicola Philippines]|uniref:PLP-dependent transferase n=1 Tax=Corynespora cassiicola Philippines TaxID=1448308 RepID=A0A2T2PC21_CORCC|nr:PLP-dependent transferase [Corynespora cassiicola Philippines]